MKVRSFDELEAFLVEDLVWRKREFTTIKFMIDGAREHERTILYKSAVALLYSHWEGYLKHSAQAYVCYLNHISPRYGDLKENFLQSSLADRFSRGFSLKKYFFQKEIFDYITCAYDSRLNIDESRVVDTQSNLKSEVLFNIMHQLALDTEFFSLREKFIDVIMVDNRNRVAHGEKVNNDQMREVYSELESDLLDMIMAFQNIIITSASNKDYLKDT